MKRVTLGFAAVISLCAFWGCVDPGSGGAKLPPGLDRNGLAKALAGTWISENTTTNPDGSVDRSEYKYVFVFSPDKEDHGDFEYWSSSTSYGGDGQWKLLHKGKWSVRYDSVGERSDGYYCEISHLSDYEGLAADTYNSKVYYNVVDIKQDSLSLEFLGGDYSDFKRQK